MTEVNEWQRGWRVLLASATGIGVGIPALINSAGLFVVPMQQEFGWSRSALAVGPIVGLIYSCLNPFGGMLIDRVGARPAAITGLALLCASLLAMSMVPAQPIAFYALLVLLGVVGTVTNNVVFCKALASWFTRNAGTAIALTLSGVSLIGALMQPLLAYIIDRYGWRMGYVALAVLILCCGLPIVIRWFRERESHMESRGSPLDGVPGVKPSLAFRDKRYWLIVAAFGGAALPIGGFVSQLQPLLINGGYQATSAAALGSVFLLATAAGRLAAGFLFDHGRPALVAGGFLAVSALGALFLAQTNLATAPWFLVAMAISLIGLAQGAEGDFIALFVLRIFGLRHFSTLFATIATASGIGFAIGGFLFTAIFDRHGNYVVAILASSVILIVTALLASTIKVPSAINSQFDKSTMQ